MEGDSQSAQDVDAEQLLLLQSPHFIQGVGLMVALTACADVVTAHAAATHLSSSSSSSGDGSSNDGSSDSTAVCGSNSSSTGGSCSNDYSSTGGSSRGHGSSSSAAWMSGVTSESELRWKIHEQRGTFATHPSGSNGSNGGCSRSSDTLTVARRLYRGQLHVMDGAWDMASSNHQLLPGPIKLLLQLLGLSSKAGLWGACRLVDRIVMFQLLLPRVRALYVSLCDGRHYMLRQVGLKLEGLGVCVWTDPSCMHPWLLHCAHCGALDSRGQTLNLPCLHSRCIVWDRGMG
jgi:hypothetical protein